MFQRWRFLSIHWLGLQADKEDSPETANLYYRLSTLLSNPQLSSKV